MVLMLMDAIFVSKYQLPKDNAVETETITTDKNNQLKFSLLDNLTTIQLSNLFKKLSLDSVALLKTSESLAEKMVPAEDLAMLNLTPLRKLKKPSNTTDTKLMGVPLNSTLLKIDNATEAEVASVEIVAEDEVVSVAADEVDLVEIVEEDVVDLVEIVEVDVETLEVIVEEEEAVSEVDEEDEAETEEDVVDSVVDSEEEVAVAILLAKRLPFLKSLTNFNLPFFAFFSKNACSLRSFIKLCS